MFVPPDTYWFELMYTGPRSTLSRIDNLLPFSGVIQPSSSRLGEIPHHAHDLRPYPLLADVRQSVSRLHTLIVTDQLNFISFGIADVKRAPMHPGMFYRFHPQPQLFESLLLGSEIRQRYLESDVING